MNYNWNENRKSLEFKAKNQNYKAFEAFESDKIININQNNINELKKSHQN